VKFVMGVVLVVMGAMILGIGVNDHIIEAWQALNGTLVKPTTAGAAPHF
jgi:hypothetical protein